MSNGLNYNIYIYFYYLKYKIYCNDLLVTQSQQEGQVIPSDSDNSNKDMDEVESTEEDNHTNKVSDVSDDNNSEKWK